MGWFSAMLSQVTTVKTVVIESWTIGLLYWGMWFLILGYVLLYQIWWARGYQLNSSMSGAFVFKVKGSSTAMGDAPPWYTDKVWDAVELVEYTANGFFVPLTMLITPQKQGMCSAGNHSSDQRAAGWQESCSPATPCVKGARTFSGVHTGACVRDGRPPLSDGSPGPGLVGVCSGGEYDGHACFGEADDVTCGKKGMCYGAFCEVKGFCPVEEATPDATSSLQFGDVLDFSVLARVDATFTRFDIRHSNVADGGGICSLNASDAGECNAPNQFTVGEMLHRAGVLSDQHFMETGAEILVSVLWADERPFLGAKGTYACDLDSKNWQQNCQARFHFTRIDDPRPDAFSHGYNFRSERTFFDNDGDKGKPLEHRELRKQTGIKVVFLQEGQGGKFDAATAGQAAGSGLALLSLATIVADFVLLYCSPRRDVYRRFKYEDVWMEGGDDVTLEERERLISDGGDGTGRSL